MKPLFAILALATVITAQPLTNRPMLGPVDVVVIQRTPVFGLKVDTRGYDRVRTKQIPRTVDWMNANGFDPLVNQFVDLAMNTPAMLDQIDGVYQERVNAWGACYPAVTTINQRKITITIEPAPFTDPRYPPDFWIAGIVDGNNIRVVVAHVHSSGSFLQDYKSLAKWEISNLMACRLWASGCPQNQAQEIAAQTPCN